MAETLEQRTTPDSSPPTPPRSGHPRGRKVFLVLAGVLALLIAGGSAFSVQAIHSLNGGFTHLATGGLNDPKCNPQTCLPIQAPPRCFTKVCNYLVLGSDSRAGLSKQQQSQFGSTGPGDTSRSDTIMFVHL